MREWGEPSSGGDDSCGACGEVPSAPLGGCGAAHPGLEVLLHEGLLHGAVVGGLQHPQRGPLLREGRRRESEREADQGSEGP